MRKAWQSPPPQRSGGRIPVLPYYHIAIWTLPQTPFRGLSPKGPLKTFKSFERMGGFNPDPLLKKGGRPAHQIIAYAMIFFIRKLCRKEMEAVFSPILLTLPFFHLPLFLKHPKPCDTQADWDSSGNRRKRRSPALQNAVKWRRRRQRSGFVRNRIDK